LKGGEWSAEDFGNEPAVDELTALV